MPTSYCVPGTNVADLPREILRERISRLLPKHSILEQAFLDFTVAFHGAVLLKEHFTDMDGVQHRLGRLTSLVEKEAELIGEKIKDWESGGSDADLRLRYGIDFLDGIANIGQGMGEYLIPIGVLYSGSHHPDAMVVQHADMLALDTSRPGIPSVVIWHNALGVKEAFRAEREGLEQLDHSRMTTLVAKTFGQFLDLLACERQEAQD